MSEYTPGEASRLLGIPGSTLRRYVIEFGDYLSPSAKKQRGREFTEADIHILARIRDLTGQGYKLSQIAPMLGEVVTEIPPEELPPQTALLIINRIAQNQASQQEQISANQERLEQLAAQLEELRAQLTAERNRSWWDRLRRRKE